MNSTHTKIVIMARMDKPTESYGFCPTCGVLEMEGSEIKHPALDKLLAERLTNGFTVSYALNGHSKKNT